MNGLLSLRTRIGRWFKSAEPVRIELPLEQFSGNGQNDGHLPVVRTSFLRPWAKRDAAIANLQRGFDTLTDLMLALRESLDTQNKRQEELLTYLGRLPEALQGIPETNRAHAETLRALHQQIAYQSQQQNRVGNLLDKIGEAAGEQQKALHGINDRLEMMEHSHQMTSENLQSIGIAMQTVSRNTDSGAKLLGDLNTSFDDRGAKMEEMIEKHGARLTTMLVVAIVVSVVSLVAVIAMGYLLVSGTKLPTAPAAAPTTQSAAEIEAVPTAAPAKPAATLPS